MAIWVHFKKKKETICRQKNNCIIIIFTYTINSTDCYRNMSDRPVINFDIENIHLMGVTFFKDGWDKGYKEGEYKKERALDGHAQEAQIHLLKLILENEPKFTMDKEIETLIYNK